MKTRRRKAVDPFPPGEGAPPPAPVAAPKGKHGGRRPGAGRKPAGTAAMSAGIYVRCSEEMKGALAAFVDALNGTRSEHGLGGVSLSTWLRELGLKAAGREDLGLEAQARAKAEAAASIV